jgi:hypothetical protein
VVAAIIVIMPVKRRRSECDEGPHCIQDIE